MSRTRRTLVLAVFVLAAMPLAPASAADFAEDCVDGPARTASAAAPHIWDDAGDATLTPHDQSGDIRAGWVGVSATGFTANIQVTSLASQPVNQKFLFSYSGALGEHYVSAQRGAASWIFGSGHLDTTQTPQRQINDGPTTGTVDAAAGVITIDLPATAVPADSTDGSEVLMPLIGIKSQFLIGTEASGGLLLQADVATYACNAIVHEADPQEEPTEAP
jgi:hypothetical protein